MKITKLKLSKYFWQKRWCMGTEMNKNTVSTSRIILAQNLMREHISFRSQKLNVLFPETSQYVLVGYESPCRALAAEPELLSQKIQI